MNLKSTLLITTLVYTSNLCAQSFTNSSPSVDLYDVYNMVKTEEREELQVNGSQFIEDEFIQGNIKYKSGKMLENELLRIDVYRNIVEVKRNNDANNSEELFYVSNSELIDYVELGNRKFHPIKKLNEKNYRLSFYETTNYDDVTLYEKYKVIFSDGRKSTNSYSDDILPSFKRVEDDVFIRFEDKIIEIDNNRRFKRKLKNTTLEFLIKYLKEKNLNIKKSSDLVELIEFYNSNV